MTPTKPFLCVREMSGIIPLRGVARQVMMIRNMSATIRHRRVVRITAV